MQHVLRALLGIVAATTLSHCALGTTKIRVTHSPCAPAARQVGTVGIRPLEDTRKLEDKTLIGNKRNGYGMVLGAYAIKGRESVSATMTGMVADALRSAGYAPAPAGSPKAAGRPVLEGEVDEFWLDLFMATWHNVGLNLRLRSQSGQVVWQRRIDAKETNVLWLGLNAEIEKVVRQAVDKAVGQAAAEFSTEAFAAAVAR